MSLRIEFLRNSTFISTLPTILKVTRAAAHPNIAPMLDCYHFWSGLSKLEDLDMILPGEIGHVHFQDVPDIPRELLDFNANYSRRWNLPADSNSGQAFGKRICRPALGGTLPAKIPTR
jgi:sugar phosphate isomerase/epimerase